MRNGLRQGCTTAHTIQPVLLCGGRGMAREDTSLSDLILPTYFSRNKEGRQGVCVCVCVCMYVLLYV